MRSSCAVVAGKPGLQGQHFWDPTARSNRSTSDPAGAAAGRRSQDAKRINETEMTLERKLTDYSQIGRYTMDFNPFYEIWAIATWPQREQSAVVSFAESTCEFLYDLGTWPCANQCLTNIQQISNQQPWVGYHWPVRKNHSRIRNALHAMTLTGKVDGRPGLTQSFLVPRLTGPRPYSHVSPLSMPGADRWIYSPSACPGRWTWPGLCVPRGSDQVPVGRHQRQGRPATEAAADLPGLGEGGSDLRAENQWNQ